MSLYDDDPGALFRHFSPEERQILEERARQLAHITQELHHTDDRSLLTVRIGQGYYAVRMDDLLAIHNVAGITAVPHTPAYVSGVVNLRGKLVTVLDMSVMIEGSPTPPSETNQLLLMSSQYEQVALLVSRTESVSNQSMGTLRALPAEMDQVRHAVGVLPDGVILLDMVALVSDPQWVVETGSHE